MVDCIVACRPNSSWAYRDIPACLWAKDRKEPQDRTASRRDRTGETLFIDARKLGNCGPARCACSLMLGDDGDV